MHARIFGVAVPEMAAAASRHCSKSTTHSKHLTQFWVLAVEGGGAIQALAHVNILATCSCISTNSLNSRRVRIGVPVSRCSSAPVSEARCIMAESAAFGSSTCRLAGKFRNLRALMFLRVSSKPAHHTSHKVDR